MNIQLKYGRKQIPFTLPSSAVLPEFTEPEYNITKESFIAQLLQYLPSEAARYSRVAIVVSDKTRLCGYPEYLPWLIDILLQKGVNNVFSPICDKG